MIPQRLRKLGYLTVAVAILTVFGAFGNALGQSLEEVSYRLKWLFNASVVGDLWTDANGIFAQNGLKVNVKPGGPERDAIKELELGRAQFGVASADQVIRAVSKGANIVVLAQLFQENPLNWIYRPDRTPFKSPEDFKGKTVGITFGGNDEAIFRTLMATYQLTETDLKLYSVRYDYTPFYEGKVDFWPLYINAQAPIIGAKLRKAGEAYSFVSPSKFGIRFVANSVITSRQMWDEHPETVKKFTLALMQGWRESLDLANQEEAIALLLKVDKETPEDIVREQLPATRKLMLPPADTEFGSIDVAAWKQTEEIMLAQKLITVSVNVEKILMPLPQK